MANEDLNQKFESLKNSLSSRQTSSVSAGSTTRWAQNGVSKSPWIMTTTENLAQNNSEAIAWYANPGDVSWEMPQRASMSKNLYGSVIHVWPNLNRKTYYDEFRLTMNFQSGNIMPVIITRPSIVNGKPANVKDFTIPSGGIANFYDFMRLVDAPKITSDGRANLVSIQYRSRLFPNLVLVGMFDPSGIRFSDSAQSPAEVTGWSATFIVYDSYPRLSDNTSHILKSNEMLNLWLQEIQAGMKK